MPKISQNNPTENQLSQSQLDTTLMYFDAFNKGFSNNMYGLQNRYYTPDMINQAMQSINMNPSNPSSSKDILNALANPKNSEEILRNYAVFFEINNLFYKRLISFNSDLLAWNLTFDCTNAESDGDFKSKQFKEDLKVIDSFCSRTNIKREFRTIVKQILRQGVYFGVFRDESDIYGWQELPPNYSKITGNSNVGKLFSFDFSYFINSAGTNIDMYPKIFKTLLRKIYTQIGTSYNPKGKIDTRHSSFVYLIDVSPRDNFFCFTLDDGLTTLIPYYSALFPDMYLQPTMRELEKNKAMISAQKLLVTLLETYDNAKSGTVQNQYKISPTDVGEFMRLVKQGVGDTIKAVAMPAKSAEVVDFNVENQNRYTNFQRNISANSVSSSASMLTENKLNAFESQLALTIDENFVRGFYGQFETFLNYYINNKTKKFKFNFKFNDVNTEPDFKKRNGQFKDMSAVGLVDINLYARATNQNIFEATRALKLTKSMGLEKYLTSLASLNNQTKESGRPQKPDSLNDNTVASQESANNIVKDSE